MCCIYLLTPLQIYRVPRHIIVTMSAGWGDQGGLQLVLLDHEAHAHGQHYAPVNSGSEAFVTYARGILKVFNVAKD